MRSRRPLISAVLAVALLVGQWLCATHDGEHGLQPGAAQACAVCVYALGAGAGALPALPALDLETASDAPETRPTSSPLAAATQHHPIRGPPALLA